MLAGQEVGVDRQRGVSQHSTPRSLVPFFTQTESSGLFVDLTRRFAVRLSPQRRVKRSCFNLAIKHGSTCQSVQSIERKLCSFITELLSLRMCFVLVAGVSVEFSQSTLGCSQLG